MHRFQGLGDALFPVKDTHQGRAEARVGACLVVDQPQVVPDQLIGGARQLHAMRLAIGEDGQQVERVALEEAGFGDRQEFALNQHAGPDLPAETETEKAVGVGLVGDARNQSLGEHLDDAGLLVVGAHQGRTGAFTVAGGKPQQGCEFLLILEGELVEVPAAEEMQRVAQPPQEVAGARDFVHFGLGDDRLLHQFFQRVDLVFHLGHPHRGVKVPQAALAFLDLRLQQID